MHFSLRSLFFSVATVTLLAGCQQTASKPSLPAGTQLDQLSALVASATFLREKCSRTDIPDNARLQQVALQEARQRNWNTGAAEYAQLGERVQSRYQALVQDSTPLTEKCAALNRSTAPFIAQAQTQ